MPATARRPRVRPGDAAWPSNASWDSLSARLSTPLIKLEAPFSGCAIANDAACQQAVGQLKNPFQIGDQPSLTQTSGWLGAWVSQPSAYAVAAHTTADVVAAVNFARDHHLRLVVKGGGHSYQGTSNAPDSLLLWTRKMKAIDLHDAFRPQGSPAGTAPQPAVTIEAGALWVDAYDAVTTKGGRYVQGGGCTSVGVAGLVQSGGFGSFSKTYGTASAGLLEAEVVTADGQVRIANAWTNPDLFWALKGGGGGGVGIVTRLTLRTRELPEQFGAVFFTIKAASDTAYRALIAQAIAFYGSTLFNPHWGEQIAFNTGNTLDVKMVFQGLTQQQAAATWAPFLAWLQAHGEYAFESPFRALAMPARHFWDVDFFKQNAPGLIVTDPRPDAPAHHFSWRGDVGEAGWFIHGYQSTWLPASLLDAGRQAALVDAVYACSRHWRVGFHFNKGLAGAPAAEIAAARDTAMNPAVLDAFALAIIAGGSGAQYPGLPGREPVPSNAADRAGEIGAAMAAMAAVAPARGSYVSESDYFLSNWQQAFWGANYARLAGIKQRYDPAGLLFTHHGVGSEAWSADGFTPA